MKPQNSNAEILRAVLLGALLYFHDLSISHNSYSSVPTEEKRQKSQAKTSQLILSCKRHEVKSIKLQKSNYRAFQTTCQTTYFFPSYTKRLYFCEVFACDIYIYIYIYIYIHIYIYMRRVYSNGRPTGNRSNFGGMYLRNGWFDRSQTSGTCSTQVLCRTHLFEGRICNPFRDI
jgi:hypothetical protein